MIRIFSGALLLVGVVAAVWYLPPIYLLAVAVAVALLAYREYVELTARAGASLSKPAGAMAVAMMCVAIGIPGLPIEVALAGIVTGLSAVALAGTMAAANSTGHALHTAALSAFAPLYIGVPLGVLSLTRWTLGKEATLLLILTVAVSDTCQYYTGRMFGRRPLAPAVSPKKTIEGALGGLVGAAIVLAVVGLWWLPQIGVLARVGLGLAIAAVGIVGDLFESLLKRSVDLKDASSVIPGHGGVLDRIDALLFAAPVYYVFVRYSF
jgi:phosphatidate cytidylyltransferase